jgi:hypothetical protein
MDIADQFRGGGGGDTRRLLLKRVPETVANALVRLEGGRSHWEDLKDCYDIKITKILQTKFSKFQIILIIIKLFLKIFT